MIRFVHIVALIAMVSCAVQSKPEGGPKDDLPPEIITQQPHAGALNYSDGVAWIVFDEYIQANSLRGNISSSPPLENIEFEVKGKKLRLNWDPEQYLEETTYRISLGDQIGDLNENNRVQNLEFVWSTGNSIDSMQINGHVNQKGESVFEGLSIWLLSNRSDSVHNPMFSTAPNKEGYFTLKYLPADTFHLFVFQDLNFDKIWNDENESFGFLKEVASEIDSHIVEVNYMTEKFVMPELDTLAVDSVHLFLDSAAENMLGLVSYILPPSASNVKVFAINGDIELIDLSIKAGSDTTYTDYQRCLPGKYEVFGYIDENNNGKWDGPSWELNFPGEQLISGQSFEVKANWELDQPINYDNSIKDEE